jgi:hypothetical protein
MVVGSLLDPDRVSRRVTLASNAESDMVSAAGDIWLGVGS